MQLRAFIFFIFFTFCSSLVAQDIAGMWQGSFEIIDKKREKINIRLELAENNGEYFGVITTRGVDGGNVYGCDYVVAGSVYDGRLNLLRKTVLRAVYVYYWECVSFEKLELILPKDPSSKKIKVKWRWQDNGVESFTISKITDTLSDIAKEELETYKQNMYDSYETNNVLIVPQKRLQVKVAELEVDSSEIALEFKSVEPWINDSIEVLINGEVIRRNYSVSKKALLLQMKPVADSVNTIMVISNSVDQPTLKIWLHLKQGQKEWKYTLRPGISRNSFLLLNRKQN